MCICTTASITDLSNLLAIMGIAIALSAYLSAIRMMAIQKIDDLETDDPNNTNPVVKAAVEAKAKKKKWRLTKKLGWLMIADVPIVLSAFLLGLYLLWDNLFTGKPSLSLLQAGLWSFLIAGTIMLLMHAVAWCRSIKKLYKVRKEIKQLKQAEETRAQEVATAAAAAEEAATGAAE